MDVNAPHRAASGSTDRSSIDDSGVSPRVSGRAWRHSILFCLLLMVLSVPGYGAWQQPTNLDRLSACARSLSDSLLSHFRAGDTLCVSIAEHPASWVLDQATLASAAARGMYVIPCDGRSRAEIALAITEIGVDYHEIDDDPDGLSRVARIACSASLTTPGMPDAAPLRSSSALAVELIDTISSGEITAVEASSYSFAVGRTSSSANGGFWSKVVEPAVILGASAVMVILLFTVRSQ